MDSRVPPVSPLAAGIANRVQREHRQREQACTRVRMPAIGTTRARYPVGQLCIDGATTRRRAARRCAQRADRRLRRTARRALPCTDRVQIATPVEIGACSGGRTAIVCGRAWAGAGFAWPARRTRRIRRRTRRPTRIRHRRGTFRRLSGAAPARARAGPPGLACDHRGRRSRGNPLDTQRDPRLLAGVRAGRRRRPLQHEPSGHVDRYGHRDGQRNHARPTAPARIDAPRARCVSRARRRRHR